MKYSNSCSELVLNKSLAKTISVFEHHLPLTKYHRHLKKITLSYAWTTEKLSPWALTSILPRPAAAWALWTMNLILVFSYLKHFNSFQMIWRSKSKSLRWPKGCYTICSLWCRSLSTSIISRTLSSTYHAHAPELCAPVTAHLSLLRTLPSFPLSGCSSADSALW